MQKVTRKMLVEKACELIKSGVADRCLAWKRGEFSYDVTPFVFNSQEEIDKEFEFNDFCGVNLSKYFIKETKKEGKRKGSEKRGEKTIIVSFFFKEQ